MSASSGQSRQFHKRLPLGRPRQVANRSFGDCANLPRTRWRVGDVGQRPSVHLSCTTVSLRRGLGSAAVARGWTTSVNRCSEEKPCSEVLRRRRLRERTSRRSQRGLGDLVSCLLLERSRLLLYHRRDTTQLTWRRRRHQRPYPFRPLFEDSGNISSRRALFLACPPSPHGLGLFFYVTAKLSHDAKGLRHLCLTLEWNVKGQQRQRQSG
mmetsp:Transcript_29818/g.79285  ORF Transcript_29818/g.79285 Transcript_29818/m.79285 type:complete len:210 (-) Transcript_29818:764-1393(-)